MQEAGVRTRPPALSPFTPSLAAQQRAVLDIRVSPQLVQRSGLLALPMLEIESAVAKELDENPALVRRPVVRCR